VQRKSGEVEQTTDDILHMQYKYRRPSWDRAQGVAILLWPTSERLVLDLDGDPDAALRLLRGAGVILPPTGVIHTGSGGRHYHFLVPPDLPKPDPDAADRDKRCIKLLPASDAAGKPCKPAVDFLFNGIVVVAGQGYREDADAPVDPAYLLTIPETVLALARAKTAQNNGDSSHAQRTTATEYVELLRGVPEGMRHDAGCKPMGHYLPKLGEAKTWALVADWCDRCTPPADKRKMRATFEDNVRREHRKPSNGS
jgi:hypothetical protein